MMNIVNLINFSLLATVLIAPMACEDVVPETSTEAGVGQVTLNLTPEEEKKVLLDNEFTLDLFNQAVAGMKEGDNLLISPISANLALSMLSNGARGTTQDSLQRVLGYGDFTQAQVNQYYNKLLMSLPRLDSATTLDIANSIWYREGFNVLPDFLDTNRQFYQAEVSALDFGNPAAKGTINGWVSDQTNGKIPEIVDEISAEKMMYLINAIYFKGAWQHPFDEDRTSKSAFALPGGTSVDADFMNIERTFHVLNSGDLQGIELPYGNGQFSMVVLMPKEGTLRQFVKTLSADRIGEIYSGFARKRANLFLPKFKFEYENTLNDELSRLGMDIAFTDRADFSGLAKESLLLDQVKQKTFIEVNEEGTEAAAVTSVGVSVTSMPVVQTMRFDKPFVFLIRENNCGLVLFTGMINNPTQTAVAD